MNIRLVTYVGIAGVIVAIGGCAVSAPPPSGEEAKKASPTARPLDPQQAERLKTVMIPLLAKMDKPLDPSQASVSFVDSPDINAANAGGGKFFVTRGLLEKANDEQLRGVMAHEIAHEDKGHVAELQTIGAGVGIASLLLNQISPVAGAIVPVAGDLLVAKPHGRQAEYEADAHAVTILRRAGLDGKAIMTNTLTWLKQTAGSSKGGFFSTHPGSDDRIQKIQEVARDPVQIPPISSSLPDIGLTEFGPDEPRLAAARPSMAMRFRSKRRLVTTPEIEAGMAFYALPWIPSKPAQGMISPPAARHALASALTEGVGFERSGGEPRKPPVNVRQRTTNEGGEMSR